MRRYTSHTLTCSLKGERRRPVGYGENGVLDGQCVMPVHYIPGYGKKKDEEFSPKIFKILMEIPSTVLTLSSFIVAAGLIYRRLSD